MRSGLLRTGMIITVLAGAGFAAPGSLHAQQDLNCEDFGSQADAQASLNSTYPDDPNRLDADHDWVACENYFKLSDADEARVIPSDVVNGGANGADQAPTGADSGNQNQNQNQGQNQSPPPQDQPTPAPVAPAPSPETPAPVATTIGVNSRVDPPADLMAQVADCEVVTVSTRSIAGAGCPGRGVVILHPPAGTPRMRSSVTIRPGAMFAAAPRSASAAQEAVASDNSERAGKRERKKTATAKQKAGTSKKERRAHREQRGARD
ncbi:MAG: hypothetical protein QM692_22825 [Thermomicrobiales bacterium]